MSRAVAGLLLAAFLLATPGTAAAPAVAAPLPRPTPTIAATTAPSPTSSPTPTVAPHLLAGTASWYCLPGRSACARRFPASGLYAAACGRFRAVVADWRGRIVEVTANGRTVAVRLIDWCGRSDRVLDLYASVVDALGLRLSRGVYHVEVRW